MNQETEQANIYTLYADNKPFYVGKTEVLTDDGKIKMTNLGVYYQNRKLYKKVKSAKNFKIRVLVRTSNESKIWFRERLKKHKEYLSKKYKLVNSDKIVGLVSYKYWQGKKRDKNTLKRLEESKYKPIVQYTLDGKFVRQWPSGKHAAKHYKCYVLENGSGSSPIHGATLSLKKKWKNWIWYKASELQTKYGNIPQQLNKLDYNVPPRKLKTVILKCDKKGNVLDTFYTAKRAAKENGGTEYFLKLHLNTGNQYQNFYWKTHDIR